MATYGWAQDANPLTAINRRLTEYNRAVARGDASGMHRPQEVLADIGTIMHQVAAETLERAVAADPGFAALVQAMPVERLAA